ncbi:hypothetical protein GE09DRAFT_1070846 [Coniochaeta sp. 2T2.1]|nr:hypothetical protein GE09DRAFT_1070846 [Coniochaeta sp. 2T2.1]
MYVRPCVNLDFPCLPLVCFPFCVTPFLAICLRPSVRRPRDRNGTTSHSIATISAAAWSSCIIVITSSTIPTKSCQPCQTRLGVESPCCEKQIAGILPGISRIKPCCRNAQSEKRKKKNIQMQNAVECVGRSNPKDVEEPEEESRDVPKWS